MRNVVGKTRGLYTARLAIFADKASRAMRTLATLFTLILVALVSTGQLKAQSAAVATLIRASRLLDPRSGNVLSPVAVLVQDGKVKEVGTPQQVQDHSPQGTKIIDLGSATLLPGLIDGHTHLFLNIIVPPEAEIQRHENGLFAPGLLLAIVESPIKRALMTAQISAGRPGERNHNDPQSRAFRN